MLPMLAMTAISGGLSLMSGMGARNAAAKQNRLQMMEDGRVDAMNYDRQQAVNAQNDWLGRQLLTVPEVTTTRSDDTSGQQTDTWGGVDLGAFMAAGEAAGFNPVTWLRSGALSLFATNSSRTQNWGGVTTTQTKTGHNAADAYKIMMPATVMGTPTQIQKVPDMLEVFGNAGQAALSTFKDMYKVDQSQQFQSSLLDRQLSAIAQRQMGGGGTAGSGGLYQTSYGPAVSMGGRAGGSGMLSGSGGGGDSGKLATSLPYPASWERGDVEVTNPHRTWKVDKDQSNAEQYSDRYGDVWEEIFGMYNVVADTVKSATGRSIREWGQRAGMNVGDYKSVGDWWGKTWGAPRAERSVVPYIPPGMSPAIAMPAWARP